MLISSPDYIKFDTIVWQLGTSCSKKCKGCYVYGTRKNWFSRKGLIPQVANAIYGEAPSLGCDELIVSGSNSPDGEDGLAHIAMRHHQSKQTIYIGENIFSQSFPPCKLRISLRSPKPFDEREMICRQEADSRAYSEPTQLVDKNIEKQSIWNALITEETITSTFLKQLSRLPTSCDVYLILPKTELGSEKTLPDWRPWVSLLNCLQKDYLGDPSEGPTYKIYLDRCVLSAAISSIESSSRRCHTDCSTMCIWPNGTVTSCPYDSFAWGNSSIISEASSPLNAAKTLRAQSRANLRSSTKCKLMNSSWGDFLNGRTIDRLRKINHHRGFISISRSKLLRHVDPVSRFDL